MLVPEQLGHPVCEDSTPAGSSCQSVRVNHAILLSLTCQSLTPVLMDQSGFGACLGYTSCLKHRQRIQTQKVGLSLSLLA